MSNPRPWFSLTKDIGQIAETTAEYVFEPGDANDRVVKLPPKIDDKIAAINKLVRRRVDLQAEAHRVDLEIERHQEAIIEQLKTVGIMATKGGE